MSERFLNLAAAAEIDLPISSGAMVELVGANKREVIGILITHLGGDAYIATGETATAAAANVTASKMIKLLSTGFQPFFIPCAGHYASQDARKIWIRSTGAAVSDGVTYVPVHSGE